MPAPNRNGWIAVVATTLAVGGAYVGGYFALGRYRQFDDLNAGFEAASIVQYERAFSFRALTRLYGPMSALESSVRGVNVELRTTDAHF